MTARGRFAILQSDYGIVPFSVLGGALRVEDRVEIMFRIVATHSGLTGAAPTSPD
jgi:hypothetical protein